MFFVVAALLLSCAKEPTPVQDPLDYLRVGVDPRQEADAMVEQLRRNGFELGHRFDERGYVALDAAHGGETLVRVVSERGVVLSLQAPDVRWPERLSVALAEEPILDGDDDGRRDVVVSLRERARVCLGWAQIDDAGYSVEVVRPRADWGERPCVLEIDPGGARLLLEVDVPDSAAPGASVRVPLELQARTWMIDASSPVWEAEAMRRNQLLEGFELEGDDANARRIRAEIDWLDRLRNGTTLMLEPANDGEEAR